MRVDVIDLGGGNVPSVKQLLARLQIVATSVSRPAECQAEVILIPGVGSAGPYMQQLKQRRFDHALQDWFSQGKTIIGICLGFQLMAQSSDEDGGVEALGLIPGRVQAIQTNGVCRSHNGWEPLQLQRQFLTEQGVSSSYRFSRQRRIDGRVFYNHEYGLPVLAQACYVPIAEPQLAQYSAMYLKDNLIGIQFHPEKSQHTGLELLAMLI